MNFNLSSRKDPPPIQSLEKPTKINKRGLSFSRNRGSTNNSILSRSNTDTKKFINYDGEETVPSEEFRMMTNPNDKLDVVEPVIQQTIHLRKDSGGTFETPRFNFGGGALHEMNKKQSSSVSVPVNESIEEVPPSEENRGTKRNDDSFAEN